MQVLCEEFVRKEQALGWIVSVQGCTGGVRRCRCAFHKLVCFDADSTGSKVNTVRDDNAVVRPVKVPLVFGAQVTFVLWQLWLETLIGQEARLTSPGGRTEAALNSAIAT